MPPDLEQHHDDFLRLFAVSEPALRAFVRSLVPRREDVPEVMQEVAVVLWRKFGDLAVPGDFRKWAFGVARLDETGKCFLQYFVWRKEVPVAGPVELGPPHLRGQGGPSAMYGIAVKPLSRPAKKSIDQ